MRWAVELLTVVVVVLVCVCWLYVYVNHRLNTLVRAKETYLESLR